MKHPHDWQIESIAITYGWDIGVYQSCSKCKRLTHSKLRVESLRPRSETRCENESGHDMYLLNVSVESNWVLDINWECHSCEEYVHSLTDVRVMRVDNTECEI